MVDGQHTKVSQCLASLQRQVLPIHDSPIETYTYIFLCKGVMKLVTTLARLRALVYFKYNTQVLAKSEKHI